MRGAHGGAWLVRIEDLDPPREIPGATADIVATLAAFGMTSDEPVALQSERSPLYAEAFGRLHDRGVIYGCACSRAEVELAAARDGRSAGVYPGTCRGGSGGRAIRAPGASACRRDGWSLKIAPAAASGSTSTGTWVISSCVGRTDYGRISSPSWSMMPTSASPTSCAALTCWTTPRAKSSCSGLLVCRRRVTCTCRWWSTSAAKSCRSRREHARSIGPTHSVNSNALRNISAFPASAPRRSRTSCAAPTAAWAEHWHIGRICAAY